MAMPTSPTRLLVCSACGATLPFEPEHAGQKCRCGSCGKVLIVPSDKEKPPAKKITPEYVSFPCRICQTVLSARVEHEGKKAKCPDCYTLNVVPPPPKQKPKQTPQAMHGQQYALWEVDEAPLPSELAAKLPQFFPVHCSLCNTLMQAYPKQIGSKLTCPDCGTKTVVLEPPPENKPSSVLVPDGEEYQLDEDSAPEPRPVPVPPAILAGETNAVYREKLQQEFGEKPKLPRLPTLQGVAPMLWRKPVPAWWLALSAIVTFVVLMIVEAWTTTNGGGGFEAIMGMCVLAAGSILGIFWFAAFAALSCSILTDSSEGNSRLFNQPSAVPMEWIGEMMFLGISLALSILPGWALGTLLAEPVISIAISSLICFPILLLSTLETGSPIEIFSTRILSSLFKRPAHWLLFYCQTTIIAAACAWVALQLLPVYIFSFILFAMATWLLYIRLLGRFAWWLAESLPLVEEC